MMSPESNTTDLQQQSSEIAQQLEEAEPEQAQKNQTTDSSSGLDVIEIAENVLDFLGDALSHIDISI